METMYTEQEVVEMVRAQCEEIGSQKNWSIKYGLSRSYVSDILKGTRGVSDTVAAIFGLERVPMFKRKNTIKKVNNNAP